MRLSESWITPLNQFMGKTCKLTVQMLLICDGFIAGAPQIARIIQRGSSEDVSILSWTWMFVMACLWVWQGKQDRSAMTFWGSVVWAINNAAVSITAAIYR